MEDTGIALQIWPNGRRPVCINERTEEWSHWHGGQHVTNEDKSLSAHDVPDGKSKITTPVTELEDTYGVAER